LKPKTKDKRYPIHMQPIVSNKQFIIIGTIILWLYLRPLMKFFAQVKLCMAQFSSFYADLKLTTPVHYSPGRMAASIALA
jgi:hypothetical protein